MSEQKHTPGPWSVSSSDAGLWVEPADKRAAVVCDLVPRKTLYSAEDDANARLIAASPDYHAAAVALVVRHDAKAKRVNFDMCGCDACEAFRPIISKATGEQP